MMKKKENSSDFLSSLERPAPWRSMEDLERALRKMIGFAETPTIRSKRIRETENGKRLRTKAVGNRRRKKEPPPCVEEE